MSLNIDFSGLLNYAKVIAGKVNDVMLNLIKGEPEELYKASLHLIKAGGKRLRPLATVLAGRMYGLSEDLGVIAGASVEIIHNFTLIHDDIIDRDEFRRGVPTVHKLWGNEMAILAGDLLFAKAYEVMSSLTGYGIEERYVLEAIKELTWATTVLAEGQALDLQLERRRDVGIKDYIDMVYRKTAALFKSAVVIGATIAGAPRDEIEKLAGYAINVGIAFQIRDDELGLVADEKVLGKPIYSDLREGKKTIHVIYALARSSPAQRAKILSVLGKRDADRERLEEVAGIIMELGALEYSSKLADEYLSKGLSYLNRTKPVDEEARHYLELLARYVTRRIY
ncbi:MAG: geranylgeranyl pyrophosphate synthase [Desulfurococcales archaeon ex4484_204]|nr:MAG: geranylgeranyl pyrophosphate synthase [Desulfurococcales archaeon ex4484_204]